MKRTLGTKPQPPIARLEWILKALADQTRLRILALLGQNEVCVCHIHDSLGLPQAKVSRHLAYLRKAGLVDVRRDGVWMHYQLSRSLDRPHRAVVHAALDALTHVPATASDRKQFQRAFGQLYVISTPGGGACCAPRDEA